MDLKQLVGVIFLGCFFVFSCKTQNEGERYTDAFVSEQLEEMNLLAENLYINQHPNPAAYINHMGATESLPDLFKKYSIGKQYHYHFSKDYDTAIQYADSLIQLFQNQESIDRYRMYYLYAILSKVDVLNGKRLYGSSIQYLLQGWQMIDLVATPCIASKYLSKLGSVSYRQGDFQNSIEYYTRGWNASKSCEKDHHFDFNKKKYQYLQNVASNYSQLEKPDSSLYYINLSLEVIENEMTHLAVEENEHRITKIARGVALGNKANEMVKIRVENPVEPLWKESIQINLQPGFANEHAQFMRIYLARYYISQNREDEAKVLLDLVERWLESNSSEIGKKRWLEASADWLESQGDFTQAYSVYKEFIKMENSLNSSNRELDKRDLTIQKLLLDNQKQLNDLKSINKLHDVYFMFSIIVLLLFLVIGYLVWRSLKVSQNHVASLSILNQTINKKNLQLERTNSSISKIINIVSHDLRSPLAGVREISAIMMTAENLSKEQKSWVKAINLTMKQSLKLTKDILGLKLDSTYTGSSKLPQTDKKLVHLPSFLKDCVKMIRFKAREKNQEIHLLPVPDVQVYINVDDMTRVIHNVIDNAVKFSLEYSPIYVRSQVKLSKVIISIEDEGIGIFQSEMKDIFNVSVINRREGTNKEESHGIGLAVSKTIVEAHNGKIWFEANDPAGSILFIELPADIS